MKKLIAGNWKIKGSYRNIEMVSTLSEKPFENVETVITVPYTLLEESSKKFPKFIKVGAQDVSKFVDGSYTGEITAKMLKVRGIKYVIIGHSERRNNLNETGDDINKKLTNSLKEGLNPILCIGESMNDRKNNTYIKFLFTQLQKSIEGIAVEKVFDIAYEPVWAIGAGQAASNAQIHEVVCYIKKWMNEFRITGRVLYGGSVSSKNVYKLRDIKSIDGFLIGGSSLTKEFEKIAQIFGSN